MIEWLSQIDHELFVLLNSLHHPILDRVMVFFSAKLVWAPLYLFLIYWLFRTFKKKGIIYLVAALLAVAATDQLTSSLMKPGFERLRPCHDPSLTDSIRIVDGCGGKYGFASGHAANTFMLAIFFVTLFRGNRHFFWLVLWAGIVAYSRIYLGVHFPGDVLVGAMLGSLIGLGFAKTAALIGAKVG
ncbi:MAG: phosphatase PAP2 family protein [Cyclobacteriaceae bacterium]